MKTFSSKKYGYADNKTTTGVETFKFEPGASFTVAYKYGLMENISNSSMRISGCRCFRYNPFPEE